MKNKGFTLVELLVSIAIILIIAGIVLPSIIRGKRSAITAEDISQLRQIGQAAEIYRTDYDDQHPLAVSPIVETGILSESILTSKADPYQQGFANAYLEKRQSPLRLDFQLSYGDFLDTFGYRREYYEEFLVDAPNPGWLLNLLHPASDSCTLDSIGQYCGEFYRLSFDTSVHHRTTRKLRVTLVPGDLIYAQSIFFQLSDGDEEWMERVHQGIFYR